MASMRIVPIHLLLAAGGSGIEGPTHIHDGGIPFPSGNVGGGVFFSHENDYGITFLFTVENY